MISPSDKEYKQTKQILIGKQTKNPDFRTLAEFIDKTFVVKTINIVYDTIDKGTRPRNGIYLEYSNENQISNQQNLYSAFYPIAKDEANERVQQDKVVQLKKELNCKELWEFLTNSTFQEISISNGWGDNYIKLANNFTNYIQY